MWYYFIFYMMPNGNRIERDLVKSLAQMTNLYPTRGEGENDEE